VSRNRRYSSYRGRSYHRPRNSGSNHILRGVVIALFILFVLLALAFLLLQDYVVYSDSGIRLELPWLTDLEKKPSPSPSNTSPIITQSGSLPSPSAPVSSSPAPTTPEEVPLHAVRVSIEELLAGTAADRVKGAGGNAALIPMKEDSGLLNYVSAVPLAVSTGASGSNTAVNDALKKLDTAGLYTVAQLSCFRDHLIPTVDANLSIRTNSGYCWEDHGTVRWSSPAHEGVTEYLADLCVELARLGFDEILLTNCGYPASGVGNLNWIREDEAYPEGRLDTVLTPFLEKLSGALESYGVKLSVWTTGSELTGETWNTGLTMENVQASCHRFWVDGMEADACVAAAGDHFDSSLRTVSFLSAAGESSASWALLNP